MREFLCVLVWVLALAGPAAADPDPHAEMAAALVVRATLRPAPAVLPVAARTMPSQTAAGAKASGSAKAATAIGQRAADQAEEQAHAQRASATGLARQAQAATMSAAGQSQAAAAKSRASHPHPVPR